MIEEGRNGMKACNAGGEIYVKKKTMLRGHIDLRHLVEGLKTEEERDDTEVIHIKEYNCVKMKCVLRRYVYQKTTRGKHQDCQGMEGGCESNIH